VKKKVTTKIKKSALSGRQGVKQTEVNDDRGRTFKLTECKLPGGGVITLTNPQEITYFEQMVKRYSKEYSFTKPNDLVRLSQLLTLELTAFRMTQRMMGQVPAFDNQGMSTGQFIIISDEEITSITDRLPKVQLEIRNLEKALKIDKTAREGDGSHDIANYFETLKRAANEYGVHLSKRYAAYDNFANELRWKIRILRNHDEEDRQYHKISEGTIIKYIEDELFRLEDVDTKFSKEKQSLWVGKL